MTVTQAEPSAPIAPTTDHRHQSPHIAAAVFGGAATLGGSSALTPLLDGTIWWQPVAITIGLILAIRVGTRLIGLPGWVTIIAQLGALPVTWTALFLTEGHWGLLPGRAAIAEADDLITAAWEQIVTTPAPAPVTLELAFLLTVAIGLTALLVDLVISAIDVPAMAAIPLLALYSVPASIAPELLPWYAFVLPTAGYAMVLATSGRQERRPGIGAAGSAVSITALAIVIAVLTTSVAGWIGTDGRIPHSGRSSSNVALSPWALLRGELLSADPVDVISVSDAPHRSYLRTFTLERWLPDEGFGLGALRVDDAAFDGVLADAADEMTAVTITPLHYRDRYLPLYPHTSAVDGLGVGWNYDESASTVFRADPVTPAGYTAQVPAETVTAGELSADQVDAARPELTDTTGVTSQTAQLARRIVAGAQTDFDKVLRLLDFFADPANGFTYSLATESGSSGDALADFLTERSGYCEQYAAAMAVMVRAVGIPARVGIGFTEGVRQPDGSRIISSTNAHAWVEVPFDGAGWVSFDPTPPVDGQGGIQGFDAADTTPPAPTTTAPTPTSDAAPTSAAIPQRSREIPDRDPVTAAPESATATATPSVLRTHLRLILTVLAGLVALGLLAATPWLIRRYRRRSLLAAADSARGAEAAWAEITHTAQDHGVTAHATQTLRDRANVIARQARLTAAERARLRDTVLAVEQSWYGTPSGEGPAHTDHAATARAVIDGLERSAGRTRIERWWPRSIRPSLR